MDLVLESGYELSIRAKTIDKDLTHFANASIGEYLLTAAMGTGDFADGIEALYEGITSVVERIWDDKTTVLLPMLIWRLCMNEWEEPKTL